jgi:hypothetical protein
MVTVADADKVIATLQTKRQAILVRRKAIETEISTIGYAAHVDSDKAAKAQIVKLNAEIATLATDETAIAGALIEAGKRQAEARKAAEAAAEAARQVEISRLAGEHRAAGVDADAALAKLIAAIGRRHEARNAMRRLGARSGGEVEAVNERRAIETALMKFGRPYEFIAPGQRITFAELDETRSAPHQAAA